MPLADLWQSQSSEGEADDVDEDVQAHAKRAANQERTKKAREQSLINRLKRKVGDLQEFQGIERAVSWADELQERYLTPNFGSVAKILKRSAFDKPNYQKLARERARVLMSYLVQFTKQLQRLLSPSADDPNRSRLYQVLDIVVVDDSSTKIRGQADQMPAVHSVLNTVQSVHVVYNNCMESVPMPTPLVILPSQKTQDVHNAYMSGLLLSGKGVGRILQRLEEETGEGVRFSDLVKAAQWKTQVFVGDAVPTNMAVFQIERDIIQRVRESGERRVLALHFKCFLHQVNLVRKPAALTCEGFWTSLVRLAHLFEGHSFKRQFAFALLQVLHVPGKVQRTLANTLHSGSSITCFSGCGL